MNRTNLKSGLALLLLFLVSISYAQTQKYFFVFLNKKPDKVELPKEEVDKLMEGHMANIQRLAKEGKLIVAGPFDGGGGIFIFKADSIGQVHEWTSSDPGIKAKRWNVEVLPYTVAMGAVCSAPEPIKMVTYEFVRYVTDKPTEKELISQHLIYLAQLKPTQDVITSGMFDNGGIAIVRGELKKELIEADPAIKAGIFRPDYKKLYVAQGAFCEK